MTSFGEVRNPAIGGMIPLMLFLQASDIQAEKRGNFIVIGCVEGSRVVSWSLNVRGWPVRNYFSLNLVRVRR